MNFYLKKSSAGRVFLSQILPAKDEELIETIDAEAYIEARLLAPDFARREGYGFFASPAGGG